MITMVAQTKGGVGKSMIAANVAAMVSSKGRNVLLVDADRQSTCNKWSSTRLVGGISPDIRVISMHVDANTSAKEFSNQLNEMRDRFDEIIVDCGGQDSKELRAALMVADVLVAPCRPTQSDIWGLDDLNKLTVQVGQLRDDLRSIVVLNMTDPLNINQAIEDAIAAIEELEGLEYAGCAITNRPTFNSAYQTGKAVSDLDQSHEPSKKAFNEVETLYFKIYGEAA